MESAVQPGIYRPELADARWAIGTEEAYEIDLVVDQIRVAMGEKVTYKPEDLIPKWAVIECRVNAEDVEKSFRPTPGTIVGMHIPGGPGVRVDRAVYTSYTIPPNYDSMIAKLICKGRTRQQALTRMKIALSEFIIDGLPTTIPFHKQVMEHPDFASGNYNLDFVEKMMTTQEKKPPTKLTLQRSSETDQGQTEEKITDKDVEPVAEAMTSTGEDNN